MDVNTVDFGKVCQDLYDELGGKEYTKFFNDTVGKPNFTEVWLQAWCDLGDEGWVVE